MKTYSYVALLSWFRKAGQISAAPYGYDNSHLETMHARKGRRALSSKEREGTIGSDFGLILSSLGAQC